MLHAIKCPLNLVLAKAGDLGEDPGTVPRAVGVLVPGDAHCPSPSLSALTCARSSAASSMITRRAEQSAPGASRRQAGGSASSRSEERRVGKEGVRKGRSRWSPYH